jgi:hypothetical protein
LIPIESPIIMSNGAMRRTASAAARAAYARTTTTMTVQGAAVEMGAGVRAIATVATRGTTTQQRGWKKLTTADETAGKTTTRGFAAAASGGLIEPHGGKLVNLMLADDAAKAKAIASCNRALELSDRNACDVELLCVGGFSPL